MTEIPTLAEVLAKHWYQQIGAACSCGWESPRWPDLGTFEQEWAAHVTEAYREARTIPDINALRALPELAFGRDSDGHLVFQGSLGPWVDTGSYRIEWPVLVVWTPRDEASR